MAIGAITKQASGGGEVGHAASAPLFTEEFSFAGDGAYPTGGTAGFEASIRGITKDNREIVAVLTLDCGGYTVSWDRANSKLKVYRTGAVNTPQEEVPNATNLSGTTFRVLVIAK